MKLTEAEIAYFAGVFDGEGCINFTNSQHDTTFLRIIVSNTNYDIVKYFQQTFGGSVYKNKRMSIRWKDSYFWCLARKAAIDFITKTGPWLRIKEQQAHVVYAFDAVKKLHKENKITKKEYLDLIEFLKEQLTFLNTRGPTIKIEPLDRVLGEMKCPLFTEKANKPSPKI